MHKNIMKQNSGKTQFEPTARTEEAQGLADPEGYASSIPEDDLKKTGELSHPHGSETILLVEDEKAVRQMILHCFSNFGYTILEASDGADAIDITDRYPHSIHLLITDVVLPGISGPDLAKSLKRKYKKMKILYISGYADAMLARLQLNEGMMFLRKPLDFTKLIQMTGTLLQNEEDPEVS